MSSSSFRSGMSPTACLVALLGCVSCSPSTGSESGAEDTAPRTPVPVVAVQASVRTLHPSLDLVGKLAPFPERVARVASRVAGSIAELSVLEGAEVAAGDRLVVLDPALYRLRAEEARAIAGERAAALALFEKGARPEEIEMARQDLARAHALAKSAKLKLDSLAELASRAELSPVRAAQAHAASEAAEVDVSRAEAALHLLEAGTRPERIVEARAAWSAAESARDRAEAELSFTTIQAPFAGTVTRLLVSTGEGLAAGTPVAEVMDLTQLLLRVRVPAEKFRGLELGSSCTVTCDAIPAALTGTLDRFDPAADAATGGVWVFVAVPNPGLLRPGMGASVALGLGAVEGCTTVPVEAVAERAGTPVVTRVVDGRAGEVEVQLGVRDGTWIQVLTGIAPGDWIATEGGYGLPDGQPVEMNSDSKTAAGGNPAGRSGSVVREEFPAGPDKGQ